jgi:hypothetical protein
MALSFLLYVLAVFLGQRTHILPSKSLSQVGPALLFSSSNLAGIVLASYFKDYSHIVVLPFMALGLLFFAGLAAFVVSEKIVNG